MTGETIRKSATAAAAAAVPLLIWVACEGGGSRPSGKGRGIAEAAVHLLELLKQLRVVGEVITPRQLLRYMPRNGKVGGGTGIIYNSPSKIRVGKRRCRKSAKSA